MNIDEPYGDSETLAREMPHTFKIDLLNHCLPDVVRDGEAVDILKPELVTWLQERGPWRFVYAFGEPEMITDPDTGAKEQSTPLRYTLRFARENDALECKVVW